MLHNAFLGQIYLLCFFRTLLFDIEVLFSIYENQVTSFNCIAIFFYFKVFSGKYFLIVKAKTNYFTVIKL